MPDPLIPASPLDDTEVNYLGLRVPRSYRGQPALPSGGVAPGASAAPAGPASPGAPGALSVTAPSGTRATVPGAPDRTIQFVGQGLKLAEVAQRILSERDAKAPQAQQGGAVFVDPALAPAISEATKAQSGGGAFTPSGPQVPFQIPPEAIGPGGGGGAVPGTPATQGPPITSVETQTAALPPITAAEVAPEAGTAAATGGGVTAGQVATGVGVAALGADIGLTIASRKPDEQKAVDSGLDAASIAALMYGGPYGAAVAAGLQAVKFALDISGVFTYDHYFSVRKHAGDVAGTGLTELAGDYAAAARSGSTDAALQALAQGEANGKVRSILEVPATLAPTLGLPAGPVEWATLSPPQFNRVLDHFAANPGDLGPMVGGSGDIPYLNTAAATLVGDRAAQSGRDLLRYLVTMRQVQQDFSQVAMRVAQDQAAKPVAPVERTGMAVTPGGGGPGLEREVLMEGAR